MAYDAESERVILFGGEEDVDTVVKDVWAYDARTNTWQEMSPDSTPCKGNCPVAYDVQSDRIIMFLGCVYDPKSSEKLKPAKRTWAYDYNADTWTNMTPDITPSGLNGPNMAYDIESDRIIMFGGANVKTENYKSMKDTWAYDSESNAWVNMEPSISPTSRNFAAMAYDAESDRVVLFGGTYNDTWLYDYNSNSWEEMSPEKAPPARYYNAMVYDVGSDRVILFGGAYRDAYSTGDTSLDDTWEYDVNTNTWSESVTITHPSARAWHAMAYDVKTEQVVLFGGGDTRSSFTDETWIYDSREKTWTDVTHHP